MSGDDLTRIAASLPNYHDARPARTRWWHRIADWYQRPPLDLDAMDRHRGGSPS